MPALIISIITFLIVIGSLIYMFHCRIRKLEKKIDDLDRRIQILKINPDETFKLIDALTNKN